MKIIGNDKINIIGVIISIETMAVPINFSEYIINIIGIVSNQTPISLVSQNLVFLEGEAEEDDSKIQLLLD